MADPKYANLYGIAHDQPDVYETADLPEADQNVDIFEEKNDSVERLHISAPEAFNVFKGKRLDVADTDFSDHIGKSRAKGYYAKSNEWEILGNDDKETPSQKYSRLKIEIEHLIEEISNTSKLKEADISKLSDSLTISTATANELLERVVGLKLQNETNVPPSCDTNNLYTFKESHFTKLLNNLDKLSNGGGGGGGGGNGAVATSNTEDAKAKDAMTTQFLLTLKPNSQPSVLTRLIELERRFSKLESLVGVNPNQIIRLCNVNIDEGLINCCQWMVAKLSLLDNIQLEAVESRINSILTRLDQLVLSSQYSSNDAEKEKKIKDLFELSKKAEEYSQLVFDLVQRMTALERLHREGTQCVQTVNHLESLQTELANSLANNETILKNLQESMRINVETIQRNMDSLKARIEKL